jgi:hypothetical protein
LRCPLVAPYNLCFWCALLEQQGVERIAPPKGTEISLALAAPKQISEEWFARRT